MLPPSLPYDQGRRKTDTPNHSATLPKSEKKGHHALRLSFIRISPLQLESFVLLSAGGGNAFPEYALLLASPVCKVFYQLIKNETLLKGRI